MAQRGPQDPLGSGVAQALSERLHDVCFVGMLTECSGLRMRLVSRVRPPAAPSTQHEPVPLSPHLLRQAKTIAPPAAGLTCQCPDTPLVVTADEEWPWQRVSESRPGRLPSILQLTGQPMTRSYVTQHVHHADGEKPVQVPLFRRPPLCRGSQCESHVTWATPRQKGRGWPCVWAWLALRGRGWLCVWAGLALRVRGT